MNSTQITTIGLFAEHFITIRSFKFSCWQLCRLVTSSGHQVG